MTKPAPRSQPITPPPPLLFDPEKFQRQLETHHHQQQKLVTLLKSTRQHILTHAEQKLRHREYQQDQCARQLAFNHDAFIRNVFHLVGQTIFPRSNPTKAEQISLIAIGGYGAGRLAPFSDIDLLFLLPGKPTQWSEQCVELTTKLLWDAGLKIGHSVRDVKNTIAMAKKDVVFYTSMMDARLLAGSASLFENWTKQAASLTHQRFVKTFVKAKLQERDIRHAKAGRSRYLVEPNIKTGKGGLRDLQTLWWLAKISTQPKPKKNKKNENQPTNWVNNKIFSKEQYQQLCQCEGMLWEIRCHLHFLCQAPTEQLTFPLQPALAKRCGFHHPNEVTAVENFMKAYFLNAKQAGDLTRILCSVLETQQTKARPKLSRLIQKLVQPKTRNHPINLTDGFILEGHRLKITNPNDFSKTPALMLHYFYLAAAYDLNFHPETLSQIRTTLPQTPQTLKNNPHANQLFLKTLASKKNPERILRVMNEAELLGWFVPEFGQIVAQMQFNMYHHFTVDEHLLHAVGQLNHMEKQGVENIPLVKKLFAGLDKKGWRQALYLAMFTHDIAKGGPHDHSQEGAKTAARLAHRFGFDNNQTEMISWLVRHHLLMSDVAQKRDLTDHKTIQDFARQVKNLDRLQLLFLLTIADIRAVGPGTWNGWKAELLQTLYRLTETQLKTPTTTQNNQIKQSQKQLSDQLINWKPKIKRDYLKLHPNAYWIHVNPETQKRHAELWKTWNEKTPFLFNVKNLDEKQVSEITLITEAHPGLFARLVGTFALYHLEVTDARIFTTHNGLAFDSFWVQNDKHQPIGDAAYVNRLAQAIEKNLMGKTLIPQQISKKQTQQPPSEKIFNIKPKIRFDNHASRKYSVIEIECLNRPDLLYGLAKKLFHQGLTLSSARIATFGERAVDVFYVTDATGQKITSPNRQHKIRLALKDACP